MLTRLGSGFDHDVGRFPQIPTCNDPDLRIRTDHARRKTRGKRRRSISRPRIDPR